MKAITRRPNIAEKRLTLRIILNKRRDRDARRGEGAR